MLSTMCHYNLRCDECREPIAEQIARPGFDMRRVTEEAGKLFFVGALDWCRTCFIKRGRRMIEDTEAEWRTVRNLIELDYDSEAIVPTVVRLVRLVRIVEESAFAEAWESRLPLV